MPCLGSEAAPVNTELIKVVKRPSFCVQVQACIAFTGCFLPSELTGAQYKLDKGRGAAVE